MFFQRVLVSLYILLFVSGVVIIYNAPQFAVESDIEKAFLRELAREYHVQRGFPVFVYAPTGPKAQAQIERQLADAQKRGMTTDEYFKYHMSIDAGVTCVTLSPDKQSILFGHLVIDHDGWSSFGWDPRGEDLIYKFGVFHEHPHWVTLTNSFAFDVRDLNLEALKLGSSGEPNLVDLENKLSRLCPTESAPRFVFGQNFVENFRAQQVLKLYGAKSVGLLMVILGLIGLSVWLSQSMQRSREFKPRRFRKDESGDCISGVETLYPQRDQQINGDGRFNPFPLMLMVDPPEEETDDQRRDRRINELQNRYFDLQGKRREASSAAEKLFSQAKNPNLSYREKRTLLSRAIDEVKKPEVVIEEVKPPLRASELRASRNSG